ncbi:MAG: hypothetical protein N2C12_13930 [Planctomycetales bacterium]
MAKSKRRPKQEVAEANTLKFRQWHLLVLFVVLFFSGMAYWEHSSRRDTSVPGINQVTSGSTDSKAAGFPKKSSQLDPEPTQPETKQDQLSQDFGQPSKDSLPGAPFNQANLSPTPLSPFGGGTGSRPPNQDPSGAVLPTPVQ